jgi:hypothetical protein
LTFWPGSNSETSDANPLIRERIASTRLIPWNDFQREEPMTSEEIKELNAARESLVKRRREMARQLSEAPLPSVEMAEELTKILVAIEALDRALNEAGHPYMSQGVVDQLRAED